MECGRIRRKKAQVAVENLLLYAAVLLLVIISVYSLWQSGVLIPIQGRKGFVGFSQVVPEDWVLSQNNRAYLSLKNEGESRLRIDPFAVAVTVGPVNCELAPSSQQIMEPAAVLIVELDCSTPPALSDEYRLGDYYEADISVEYTNLMSDTVHMSVGKLYGVMESVPSDFVIPTSSTTSLPLIEPQCFYHECNVAGGMDDLNCGNYALMWGGDTCNYCPLNPDPYDGKRKCWWDGACGQICNIDSECYNMVGSDPLNLCTKCLPDPMGGAFNTCQETDYSPSCGPCTPYDPTHQVLMDSAHCDVAVCPYCYHEWIQTGSVEGDGYDFWGCDTSEDCGASCLDYGFDVYDECSVRCMHCEPDTATPDPTDGFCTQGDCGRRCGPNAPIEQCEVGCLYCNLTSYKCEEGDCGRECGPLFPSVECLLGCDVCHSVSADHIVCVKLPVGVSILAHNGSGGKVVQAGDTIYLDVTGQSGEGIEQIIVSNSITIPPGYTECTQIANEINFQMGQINDPLSGPEAAQLLNDWGISWMGTHSCSGLSPCTNTWTTSEASINRYCYFAMAQQYSSAGDGRWSQVVTDYIRVGIIDVYLAYPKPEGTEPGPT